MITRLDEETINQIAAGEVIERPAAVVKELVENAMDAGANAVTVEIKEGGISLIRVTDNGGGISGDEIPVAFERHATSKIRSAEDLLSVTSLGFRGEALSSIAAVAQVELVTKTSGSLTGTRYLIEGGAEKLIEEIGCPEGTTIIARNLFFNTPARRKFLKSAATEAGYVSDLVEHLAVSHPQTAVTFISNNQVRLHTSGNHNLKDIIYHIYGREITAQIVPVTHETEEVTIHGYIGKPMISRGNRNYMNYFINGRYIRSILINQAIEEAYRPYTMKHKYPFTILSLQIPSGLLDVNVHPSKLEVRFLNQEEIYDTVRAAVSQALMQKELIPEVMLTSSKPVPPKQWEKKEGDTTSIPEPFERVRRQEQEEKSPVFSENFRANENRQENMKKVAMLRESNDARLPGFSNPLCPDAGNSKESSSVFTGVVLPGHSGKALTNLPNPHQMELSEGKLLSKEAVKEHRIIGQVFDTYWIVQFQDKLFLIDQHAAHEKVLYERTIKAMKQEETVSQFLEPPVILTLSLREQDIVKRYQKDFSKLGFVLETFGGDEISVRAVPANLTDIAKKDLLLEMIDDLASGERGRTPDILTDRIAAISCKAAVKGNHRLSVEEAAALIDELLTLENPYHCPHGRPTIISMSRYEIEKKFRRVL